jgi:hypothetical protein
MKLEEKVDAILSNHLPHLSDRISKLEGQMTLNTALTLATLAAIVGSFILQVKSAL